MSWSTSAVGRPAAVAVAIAKQISSIKCQEPEETIKAKVGEIVAAALAVFPEGSAVMVTASGSQSYKDYNKPELGASNSLNFEIKPLYGFVE